MPAATTSPVRASPIVGWVPRFFRVRGWAPPGTPPEANITKSEAAKLNEDIRRLLSATATTELELDRLGFASHELRCYASESSEARLRRWKGRVQDSFGQLRMRGCGLACTFQVNPERAHR